MHRGAIICYSKFRKNLIRNVIRILYNVSFSHLWPSNVCVTKFIILQNEAIPSKQENRYEAA